MNIQSFEIDVVELEREVDLVMDQLIRAWEGNRIEKEKYYTLLDQRQELLKMAYEMLDSINQRLNIAMRYPRQHLPSVAYHRCISLRRVVRASIKRLKCQKSDSEC